MSPEDSVPGAGVLFSVSTLGDAHRVQVYLSAGPGGAGPFTYSLTQTSDGHWSAKVKAPDAPGEYSFTVGVFDSVGHRSVDANGAWQLTLEQPQPTAAPTAALPANLPLAPGFSYGNPQPAVFNANGQVIQGSEIVSTSNTAEEGAAVGQFFERRLPRAGWTISSSNVPQTGSDPWTIVAVSGSTVTVIEYTGGTLSLYYGSTG